MQGGVAGPAERKGPFPAGGTSPPQQGDEKTGAWAADWCFVWLGLCVAWVPRKRGDTEICAQVAYWEDEIKLEGLQWSEHQANPGDGMALGGLRELTGGRSLCAAAQTPSLTGAPLGGGAVGRGSPFSSGQFSPRSLSLSCQPATLPAAEGIRALVLTGESPTVCTRVCSPSLAPLLFQVSYLVE